MLKKLSWRKYLLWALAVVVVIVGGYILYRNFQLTGPDQYSIATGRSDGAYHRYAEEYALSLADEGVTLDIAETAGSTETLDKIIAREVPVGFVQSGSVEDRDTTDLYSLGTMFYEPIMVFHRKDRFDTPLEYIYDLEGYTVNIGELGSGTNTAARRMLAENGLDDSTVDLRTLATSEAYEQLTNGEIDAAFFVLSPAAEIVMDLLLHPDLELMNLRRASAYSARYPYLTEFTISEGTADLGRNIPAEDKAVLATTAMLVANELLHVDSARQLLTAAMEVHAAGDYFAENGEFPSVKNSQLPVPRQIEEFLEFGPSDLEEFLPVSLATIIQRFIFIVLPAIILIYPLLRGWPGAYSFANRYRVYRWYQHLRQVEAGMNDYSVDELDEQIAELHALEERITERMRIPMFYQRDFYNLRFHIRLVIERFEQRRAELIAAGAEETATDETDADGASGEETADGPTKRDPEAATANDAGIESAKDVTIEPEKVETEEVETERAETETTDPDHV